MSQLVKELNTYRDAYYNLSQPTVSDSVYDAKYDDKSDAKYDADSDVDSLDNITDWAIRDNFDNNKSINRIAEYFFKFNQKEAWDNIKRINGLQKANEKNYAIKYAH